MICRRTNGRGTLPNQFGWLPTDIPGLVPFVGAGGTLEDVRVWAWLSFSRGDLVDGRWRGVSLVDFGETLPDTAANEPADPSRLIWFYPGEWFGLRGPVPSVQMKWLRRAPAGLRVPSSSDATRRTA